MSLSYSSLPSFIYHTVQQILSKTVFGNPSKHRTITWWGGLDSTKKTTASCNLCCVVFLKNSLAYCSLGLHSARYLNFRKAATRSHSSGRKWPQVAALSSGRKWPQVAAFDAWPRCFNLIKSSHLQPLAATRVAASGRFSRVAASGREWPLFPSGRKWPRVAAFTT